MPLEAVNEVKTGKAQLTFLMNPVRMEQVRDIAFEGDVMPRRSTRLLSKMLSGLTIYSLDAAARKRYCQSATTQLQHLHKSAITYGAFSVSCRISVRRLRIYYLPCENLFFGVTCAKSIRVQGFRSPARPAWSRCRAEPLQVLPTLLPINPTRIPADRNNSGQPKYLDSISNRRSHLSLQRLSPRLDVARDND